MSFFSDWLSFSSLSWVCFSCHILSESRPDDEIKKKKKKAVGTLSVTSMLKKFQKEKEKERQKLEKATREVAAIMDAATIPLCPADAAGGGGSGLTDPLLSLIGSTNDHALIQAANTMDFDIDLDCLLDVSEGTRVMPQPATETHVFQPKPDEYTQVQPYSEQVQLLPQTSSTSSHQRITLLEGLPPGLETTIQKLTAVRLRFICKSVRKDVCACIDTSSGWMCTWQTNFSGCQDLRWGVKSQVFHSRNQLDPARVSNSATQTKLCQVLDNGASFVKPKATTVCCHETRCPTHWNMAPQAISPPQPSAHICLCHHHCSECSPANFEIKNWPHCHHL